MKKNEKNLVRTIEAAFKLIRIVLPWTKDATFMLLANQELVAFEEPRGSTKVKKERCVQCGECCHDTPDGHTPFGSDLDKCNACQVAMDGTFPCTAGPIKPFRCLPDPNQGVYPNCSIRYF